MAASIRPRAPAKAPAVTPSARLALPERRRNYRFALTPLADAMFQLLIFFMLSASLTPYSPLTLQSAPPDLDETATPGEQGGGRSAPTDMAIWTLRAGQLDVAGQSFELAAVDGLAAALGRNGAPAGVVLVVKDEARVQDLATVLAKLQAAEVAAVQVSREWTR
jgi:biopolymer transport protein ExbD